MLVFTSTNMHDLRQEIVEYLRTQMRNSIAHKNNTNTKQGKALCDARAFALGTAADSLESATFQKKGK